MKAGDGELKKFSMEAYNGGELKLKGFSLPVVIDLSTTSVTAKSRPILRDHDQARVIGHTTRINISATDITVDGVVSGTGDDAKEVLATSANGFPWQASVGAVPGRLQRIAAGKSVVVNGRRFEGPILVARDVKLREVSFVALGADDSTTAKVAASGSQNLLEIDMNFEQWLKAKGFEIDELNETQLASLQASYDAEIKASEKPEEKEEEKPAPKVEASADDKVEDTNVVEDIRAQAVEETARINEVRTICASFENLSSEDRNKVEASAISEGWSADKTELECLRLNRSSAPAGHVKSGDINAQALEAAVCLSAGLSEDDLKESYDEKTMNAALSEKYRDSGIVSIMQATLRAAGKRIRTDVINDDVIRATLHADQEIQAAGGGGGFSTVSLSGILSNVANKSMLSAYNAVATTVGAVASSTSTRDFKEFTRYRLLGVDRLEEVGPGGEIKHTTLQEQSFPNRVKTHARMIALTRTMMVNDDLGAFRDLPRIFGRMAALTLERTMYELILSNPTNPETGNAFFSAADGNLFTGAGSELSIAGLTQAEQGFLDQTDPAGDPILVNPVRLLVPTSLKVAAESLFNETRVNETTTTDKKSTADNPHAGKFRPIATPYLNSQGLTGSSATAWYLMANPSDLAFIEVAYLRGRRTPVLQSAETDFNTLGMQWRTVFDFGFALQDYRAANKSAGA